MRDALITKYRPQKLKDMLGQKGVVAKIEGMLSTKKIPNALLITGPTGCGKTTSARLIARYLMCETFENCGECKSCLAWRDESTHPDYAELDGTSANKKEDVMPIIQMARLMPQKAQFRIIMLDECHKLTGHAASALLKPVEEPPAKTLWILATSEPQVMLETLKNRCTRLDLNTVDPGVLGKYIKKIAKKEGVDISDKVAESIGEASDGFVRASLSVLEGVLQFMRGNPDASADDLEEAVLQYAVGANGDVIDWQLGVDLVSAMVLGTPAAIPRALANLVNPIPVANQVLWISQYCMDQLCKAQGKKVIPSAGNRKAWDTVMGRAEKAELKIGVGRIHRALTAAVECRSRMQAFSVDERSLMTMLFMDAALDNIPVRKKD